jgi:large subunit ribosomal protein L13
MKTHLPKVEMNKKKWHIVDAEGKTLGRVAARIATVLRGKHTPNYTPHLDMGDFVVVINAEKVHVTGKKLSDKVYYHHSGYPGGLKTMPLERLLEEKPEEALKKAVWGMLPHNRLGRAMFRKLKIYAGASHPHAAQTPKSLNV